MTSVLVETMFKNPLECLNTVKVDEMIKKKFRWCLWQPLTILAIFSEILFYVQFSWGKHNTS